MISAIVVLAVAQVVSGLHFIRRISKLERDLDEAWRWVRFYQNLAATWQSRATVGAGLEPYWKWAEDDQELPNAANADAGW